MTFQLSNSLNLAELLVNPLTNSISQKTFTNIFPSIRVITACTAQKMKFPIKDFFSKCDQIRSKLRIWSHLLMKSLMENFIFCVVLL